MPATPDSFRLNQNPLGAYHLPQALTFVAHSPLRARSFASSGGVAFSSVSHRFPRNPILPHGVLEL